MTFLAAIGSEDDPHRKPNPLMWDVFCEKFNGKIRIDKTAAGRKASETRYADFSNDDKLFAKNIGLSFSTPEQ